MVISTFSVQNNLPTYELLIEDHKMDYDLSRIDYTICGITYPDTLKVLISPGPKLQNKFAIGDKNGVLQCLSIKDEEPVIQFKTLPGKPITSVQIASAIGAPSDKIFAASGNEVKGYTRKGKVFLSVETSLSETITSMCVIGSDLILCSGRTVTYYRDLRELYSYTCDDRILDIAAFATPNTTRVKLLVLIANKGAIIIDSGQQLSRAVVASGPSRLAAPPLHTPDVYAFYGAVDGSIGLFVYDKSTLSSRCLVEERGLGSVVCLGWFYNSSGSHLAVGRHDGSVQLYLINLDNLLEKPRLKFSYFCGEPVTSVWGGCVGTEENELLVATYSGRIFALRSRRLISGPTLLTNVPHDALAQRRTKLESEIARLEKQTASEREKYQRNTRSVNAGLSAPPLLDIQYELAGATYEGWQEAKITSSVPLDMLFINSNRKLDMLTDNAAVLSICSSQGSTSDMLATVRCQAGTRRLWVRMRYTVGSLHARAESVKVLVYALPAGAPRVARLLSLRLPALPYYSQYEAPELEKDIRSWCELQVQGSFSVAEMTSWLTEALPGELPKPATTVAFARRHTLLGTVINCQYQRASALFKSDNLSTISVIKDLLSNCAVRKSIRLDLICDAPKDSCLNSFERIKNQFIAEYQKNRDINLKKAVSALDLDYKEINDESPILCEDYLRVWNSSDKSHSDSHFNELVEIVEHWYIDWQVISLNSKDFKNERMQLKSALQECDLDQIVRLLSSDPMSPVKIQ